MAEGEETAERLSPCLRFGVEGAIAAETESVVEGEEEDDRLTPDGGGREESLGFPVVIDGVDEGAGTAEGTSATTSMPAVITSEVTAEGAMGEKKLVMGVAEEGVE